MRFIAIYGTAWLLMATTAGVKAVTPIDVGDRRQVFIDRFFLAESKGIEIVVHPPRKTGELTVKPERPWESGGIGPYSSVLWDGKTYHMWYHAMDTFQWDQGLINGSICYARSNDGIRWERVEAGLIEYKGDRRNNIVFGHGANGMTINQDGGMVFLDPNAPAEERFRLVCRFGPKKDGMRVFSSGDGIHWKLTHPSIVTTRPAEKMEHLDSQNVVFWDESLRKYVAYVRYNRPETRGRARSISRGESDRLGDFPLVQDMAVVFQPDADDLKEDNLPVVDFYVSAAVKYPWADRAYFMFPTAYYHYTSILPEFEKACPANAGPLDSQFAASHDGVTWDRFDRKAFVPLGMKGEFDWGCVRMIWGLVPDVEGREMYLYYRGGDWLHGWDRNENNKQLLTEGGLGASRNLACISRVVSRRDGFTSARGAYVGGEFTTPVLKFSGREMLINVNTSATGMVRVAILDEAGQPIDGYTAEQCDLIHTTNEINRVVSWKHNRNVGKLAGKPIRIRFLLRNADLYALQFRK